MILGVAAAVEGVEPEPGLLPRGALRRGEVLGPGRGRPRRGGIQDDADRRVQAAGAVRAHGEAVAEEEVVGRAVRGGLVAPARGVEPVAVAEEGGAPGLVDGEPAADAVAQRAEEDVRVVGEALRGPALGPAPRLLEGRGQVPVVDRRRGLDAGLEEGVGQAAVVVEAGLERPARAGRLDARPGDGEAVRADAEASEELDILGPAAVGVAGEVAGHAPEHGPGPAAEVVPYRPAAAVRRGRALDLVGGGRRAPEEARGEAHPFTAPPDTPFVICLRKAT